jgi:hypothetical protein
MLNLMKIGLFSNIRDEKHIKEWVMHHLLLKIDYIIVFDHKSKIPVKNELEKISKRVKVLNANHVNTNVKIYLMNLAAKIAKQNNFDWMIYLDADEFIILNEQYNNIHALLSRYEQRADSVAINWLMFGSNFKKKDPDGLILENYTRSEELLNQHVKSFVKPREIISAINPHYYNIKNKNRYYALNNVMLKNQFCFNDCKLPYNNVPAYIAHYVNQSEESYVKRKSLPRDDTGTKRNLIQLDELHKEFNNSINNYPNMKYSKNVKDLLARFNWTY